MLQVRKTSLKPFLEFLLCLLLLAGCGGGSLENQIQPPPANQPVAVVATHPAGWLPGGHVTDAKANVATCTVCHGSDLTGATTHVSCTQCHIGNPQSVHPTQWGNFAYALHSTYVRVHQNDTSSCSNVTCHGLSLEGVPGSGPSCIACPMGGVFSKHIVAWNTNIELHKDYISSSGSASCRVSVCHGTDLKGVFLSGPSCGTCHSWAF
jgi:hypothetical protein